MKTKAEIWRERFYDFLDRHDARECYDRLANREQVEYVAGMDPQVLVAGTISWPKTEIWFWANLNADWLDECRKYEDDLRNTVA